MIYCKPDNIKCIQFQIGDSTLKYEVSEKNPTWVVNLTSAGICKEEITHNLYRTDSYDVKNIAL